MVSNPPRREYGTVQYRSIAIDNRPLDLRSTLFPLHGKFADDGWWLAARTPQGAGSLRVRRTKTDLIGEAWGEGSDWLLDRLGATVGLDDDPSRFVTDHPLVSELHRAHPGDRFGRTGLAFQALVVAICAQKVTGREARSAMRGLMRDFSAPAPGPNDQLRLPPDPDAMAAAPYHRFHTLHLEKRRADLLRAVSRQAERIDELAGVDVRRAVEFLESFRGISRWTTAKTLEVSHGDPDQVAVGDFHFKHIVVHHLTGRDRGTDEEMLQLLEPFRPHRGRVIRLLHTLGHEPKFGPRLTPRDITGM
ncbi:MAG TPA: DNA-3-methyladenine glycosylase 2 family protein [Acidimicrobiia bacterium]|nr:DNA-3-methyladenine glycosylase 2 family protein [Acidimicrobiia bacterium]